MKKLTVIGFALLALGCTTPRPATTPTAAPEDQKLGEEKETRTTISDDTDGKSEDQNRITGYGEDPGEETQE
jgi:hypothetical protein